MRCPQCDELVSAVYTNPDRSRTCSNCGFTFDPVTEAQWNPPLYKVIEAANNLRSLIVTLSTGQDVTLSYPKDLEPTEEAKRETWRDLLTQHTIVMCSMMFRVGIVNTVFDDEIELKHG